VKTGLQPRDFRWVIKGRLAVSQRPGGIADGHRRIRRAEEITWLQAEGFTTVLSLCDGNQNLAAYEEAGLESIHHPVASTLDPVAAAEVFEAIVAATNGDRVTLVHKDTVDDLMSGLLGGFLVFSGLVKGPVQAMAIIQEIVARPLGPLGRSIIPDGDAVRS
jgi:hypothetical protein